MNEIPVEEYVGEVLAFPKEYQSKTERGKSAKAKWDALKEPVKIAKRMVNVTNCEKRLRAIAVKEEGKKSIDVLLTNILASICSAKGVIDEYRNRGGVEVFFKKTLLEKYQNVGIKILNLEERCFGKMQSCISMRMDLSRFIIFICRWMTNSSGSIQKPSNNTC
nr:hypothetical protein BSM_06620 [uncultured archaeon]